MSSFKYPIYTKIFHWLFAISVLSIALLGIYMEDLENSQFKFMLYDYHKAFGVLTVVFIVGLLISRRTYQQPEAPSTLPPKIALLAKVVKYLLFILAIGAITLGYLASSAFPFKEGIWFFGFELPAVLDKDKELSKMLIEYHGTVAMLLLFASILHIAGVLKHRFFDKENDVLERML
jgi:cytochrome b561